ncbi:MAG: hypothetical protein ACJAX3_001188 [Patiriisocius sp.]|jgi:hypothetical protein
MFKRIVYIVTALFVLASCGKSENEMRVTGAVTGLKKGTLLLQKLDDTLVISVDSIQINGVNAFSFEEEIISPEMYYLYLRLDNGNLVDERIPFFGEATDIHIKTSLELFGSDAIISGSKNDSIYRIHQKLIQRYIDRNLDLTAENFEAIRDENDSLLIENKAKQNRLLSSKYLATVNFVINHNDYEAAPYLALTEIYDANIKYLDTVYTSLTPKIKDSKYGITLESFIANIKKSEN